METSLLLRADWVCPIAEPPLRDGWVHIEGGRVTAVGAGTDAPAAARQHDLGCAAILPGLVNAHTHLELSWMRGRVAPASDFLAWVGQLMRLRTGVESASDAAVMVALRAGACDMRATGTVAVGDISNSLVSPAVLTEMQMPGVVFHELIGFRVVDGRAVIEAGRAERQSSATPDLRVVAAAHAPFSVSRELFLAICDDVAATPPRLTSVHVAESSAEVQLLATGDGPWRERLEELGAWRSGWSPPRQGPGDYLCDLGVLGPGSLAVHGVHLRDDELSRLADCGATLVTCPRSNTWVGVGAPPVERFFASGVAIAIGTDSLASAPDLNLFAEVAELHHLAPQVAPRRLLEAATRGGARALGLDDRFGSIAPGKDGRLVSVSLPPRVSDPEEVLVRGIQADRISWVGAAVPEARG